MPRPLPETADATNPIFSPDGKWIAFIRSNQIYRMGTDGSRPQLLAPAPGNFGGMSWSSTGVIVISGNVALYTIPETGGQPRELVKPNRSAGELYFYSPLVLDDEGAVLYASSPSASAAGAKLEIASLKTGERTNLGVAGSQPLGMASGALTYVTAARRDHGRALRRTEQESQRRARANRQRCCDQRDFGSRPRGARPERYTLVSKRDTDVPGRIRRSERYL